MTNVNIGNLSVAELNQLKGNIDDLITHRRQEELLELREKVDDIVNNSGFTLEEIMSARPPRKAVEPKYANPDNPNETWTGRGRRPAWVEQKVKANYNLDDLLIKK